MNVRYHVRGATLLVFVYAYLRCRGLWLWFLRRETRRRWEELRELANIVGVRFLRCTQGVSAYVFIPNGMGYDTDKATGKRISGLCWNAPIAVVVYIDNKPYVGLGVELRRDVLSIVQMQGVRGVTIPAAVKNWPTLFVQSCMAFAERKRLREVRVYKANRDVLNYSLGLFLEVPEGQTGEEAMQAYRNRVRRRYDRTAADLGFEKTRYYYRWRVPKAAS